MASHQSPSNPISRAAHAELGPLSDSGRHSSCDGLRDRRRSVACAAMKRAPYRNRPSGRSWRPVCCGEPQSGIVMSSGTPSRDISNSALWWGAAEFKAAVSSAKELTGVPSTESNTSPSTIPALAPAPPASTLRTIRPRSESILSPVADPGETGRNTTPRREP